MLAGCATTALLVAVALASWSCAAAPVVLTPRPAPPPTCPIDGCEAKDRAAPVRAKPIACRSGREASCAGIVPEECAARALASWSEARDERDVACVARMLTEACDLGATEVCRYAGRMWIDGRGVDANPPRGMAMIARACDAGDALACLAGVRWLAEATRALEVSDGERMRRRLEFEERCLAGASDACFVVGVAFGAGREGFPRDVRAALRAWERGCNLGDAGSCKNLGDTLAYESGVARDAERATAAFERACGMGATLGCANFAYRLETGQGVARDLTRARALYRESCAAGAAYACMHIDMLAARGAGAPADPARALAYWQNACDRRDARACAFVALMYDDATGTARDEAKSLEAMSRACSLGERRACAWTQARGAQ